MLATQLQLRQARHEASQLELVKTAQADEIKALHAKLDELQEVHKSTSNELTDVTALRAELAELKLVFYFQLKESLPPHPIHIPPPASAPLGGHEWSGAAP